MVVVVFVRFGRYLSHRIVIDKSRGIRGLDISEIIGLIEAISSQQCCQFPVCFRFDLNNLKTEGLGLSSETRKCRCTETEGLG